MKIYYRFYVSVFCILIIFPHTAFAVSDVVGFSSYEPVSVKIQQGAAVTEVSTSEYLKGVLSGEIGSWADSNHQAAFTCQAIAVTGHPL